MRKTKEPEVHSVVARTKRVSERTSRAREAENMWTRKEPPGRIWVIWKKTQLLSERKEDRGKRYERRERPGKCQKVQGG